MTVLKPTDQQDDFLNIYMGESILLKRRYEKVDHYYWRRDCFIFLSSKCSWEDHYEEKNVIFQKNLWQ